MKNFIRKYRFIASPPGGAGFEVGQGDPMPLRINFSIEKADTETPNTAKISLWNLNPEHIAILNEKDCMVKLFAGYEQGHTPLCFIGDITYVKTIMDGADRETMMEVADGRVCLRDTYVSKSYAGVINTQKIIDDVAGDMGIPVDYSYNCGFADFPNGFSYVGPARVALDKACATSDNQWHIYDGILCIKNYRDTMDREVYVISPNTGLVGIPKRITYSEPGFGLDEEPGWEVKYFLNGAIGVSDFIRLESREVQGYFRVKWLEMNGDNIQGDWMCTARLIYV